MSLSRRGRSSPSTWIATRNVLLPVGAQRTATRRSGWLRSDEQVDAVHAVHRHPGRARHEALDRVTGHRRAAAGQLDHDVAVEAVDEHAGVTALGARSRAADHRGTGRGLGEILLGALATAGEVDDPLDDVLRPTLPSPTAA